MKLDNLYICILFRLSSKHNFSFHAVTPFSLPCWSEWHPIPGQGLPDPWPWSCVCNLFICQCLLIRGDPGAEHKLGFDKLFAPITDYLNIDDILCTTRHAYGRGPTDRIKHYGGMLTWVYCSWPRDHMLTFGMCVCVLTLKQIFHCYTLILTSNWCFSLPPPSKTRMINETEMKFLPSDISP